MKKRWWFPSIGKRIEYNAVVTMVIRIFMLIVLASCIVLGIIAEDSNFRSYFYISAFTSVVMLILTFVPSFINDNTPIIIPTVLQTIFVVFILLAEYFGEILRFYDIFPWWDVMLHTCSGVLLGIVGVLVVYSLNRGNDVIQRMHPFSIMLFGFCFALACGALWEIFEYTGDRLLGMNMQCSVYVYHDKGTEEFNQEAIRYFEDNVRFYNHLEAGKKGRVFDPGLVDTMEDIVVDTVGALISVVLTHFYMDKMKKVIEAKNGLPPGGNNSLSV